MERLQKLKLKIGAGNFIVVVAILIMLGVIYSKMAGVGFSGAAIGIIGIGYLLYKSRKMFKEIENADTEE